jgi:hypothetical protein
MARTLVAVLLAAGCAGTPSTTDRAAAPTGVAPTEAAPTSAAAPGDPSEKAKAAFRAYVAKLLKVPASEVHGGPADNGLGDHTRGAARHYVMWPGQDTMNSIRGWVTPDGTVITPEQNLGVLFVEAGVWARPSKQRLEELAYLLSEDIIWAYGSQGKDVMFAGLGGRVTPAEFKLAPDGSGTFRFFHNNHGGALITGGGGAPPDVYWENVAVLTADHKATLTRKELRPQQ